MDCKEIYRIAADIDPFPYQRRMAEGPWPDLLRVPTGLGKTAAVVLGWICKRRQGDPETPRRLIYCLPMRTLVHQIADLARGWIKSLVAHGLLDKGIPVYILMGGAEESAYAGWDENPEEEAIIIGTQDMLLSRALNRGYGMSRYRWPIHFALLHNDAMWVFDEVQLMQAGLPTSTQLEAFRRALGVSRPCRTLWVSATLRPEWLATFDFEPHLSALRVETINAGDLAGEGTVYSLMKRRLTADKLLTRAPYTLAENTKAGCADYLKHLADTVVAESGEGTTLVILNRVDRAQGLFKELNQRIQLPLVLVHARFRRGEREALQGLLNGDGQPRVVIATQAIEAGVDISSRLLITELAPWSSLVQRFGRCNRYGEWRDAKVCWIDLPAEKEIALPYSVDDLVEAREKLQSLTTVSPGGLPEVSAGDQIFSVIRRRDLMQLFNTDADLSGYDIDIAHYIRDKQDTDVQVFWRELKEKVPDKEIAPGSKELCPVSIAQFHAYRSKKLGGSSRPVWHWDPLGGYWSELREGGVRPGAIYLLDSALGGYDPTLGFSPDSPHPVPVLEQVSVTNATHDDEPDTDLGVAVPLHDHSSHVVAEARALVQSLCPDNSAIVTAAAWHDAGKAHPAFQNMVLASMADPLGCQGVLWAKSDRGHPRPSGERTRSRAEYALCDEQRRIVYRPHFRHELVSALAWLAHHVDDPNADLVAYLIAAHHGKVRMGIRALANEAEPHDRDAAFARGVWEGDPLPPLSLPEEIVPETKLTLDVMKLGGGATGRSWTSRTSQLLELHGPFRLAWYETLVRIADWRASEKEKRGIVDG